MAKRRYLVEFQLLLAAPSGIRSTYKDRALLVYRSLLYEDVVRLFDSSQPEARRSWSHQWSDGWGARVTGRVTAPGEKRLRSDGFAGYDWMVDNIIRFGQTEEPKAAPV